MDERARRVAANEAVFRTVNEKLHALNEAFAAVTSTVAIVCECGDIACAEQIELSEDDYARLRSDPTWFAIIRGHHDADSEDVVERHDAYDVVRKHEGMPARFAEESAP
ncbi:MAG TPA: hypothetical protein VM290_01465 [Gaiellaceae bacterium]|nr:hypothetical protein [Gaiellaceae bacterium]